MNISIAVRNLVHSDVVSDSFSGVGKTVILKNGDPQIVDPLNWFFHDSDQIYFLINVCKSFQLIRYLLIINHGGPHGTIQDFIIDVL